MPLELTWVVVLTVIATMAAGLFLTCVMLWVAGVSVRTVLWPDTAFIRPSMLRKYKALLASDVSWTERELAMSRLVEIAQRVSASGYQWVRAMVESALRDAKERETYSQLRVRMEDALSLIAAERAENGEAHSADRTTTSA